MVGRSNTEQQQKMFLYIYVATSLEYGLDFTI